MSEDVWPTRKELLQQALKKEKKCTYCRPNKGENANRKPKHKSKPKGKR